MFISITDQCYRTVELPQRPLRIVSLVPSQTELLIDLGLEEQLVGITRFCEHPTGLLDRIRVVGGTKKVVMSRIWEAQPDLIICNKEENTQEIVLACQEIAPTYVSDISNLDDATEMIADIGKMTGTSFKAKSLVNTIKINFNHFDKESHNAVNALYLIWKNPYMTVGSDTFIHDIMERGKYKNIMDGASRYPELTLQNIINLNPEVILFSSEPYSFSELDKKEIEDAFAKAELTAPKLITVDGTYFSWYGSRLKDTPAYFRQLHSN
ncbi:putative iron (III) ABC transporter, periplasmic binding protein [Flavobacteria bacterium BBFL7]|nr:putative iron (III) ABC transporter, periplasmic binding protein [Flavobacteria bacterium BBFL7]